METQNATIHLSPPNVDHATVRSSTPSRTGEKKKNRESDLNVDYATVRSSTASRTGVYKKKRESDLPHSQPTPWCVECWTDRTRRDRSLFVVNVIRLASRTGELQKKTLPRHAKVTCRTPNQLEHSRKIAKIYNRAAI
jgi:hypothetical protein